MKIRSRGLGRRELKMDLHEFKVSKEGHEVVVSGVTHAPVTWETVIRIAPEDIGGMLRVALSPKVIALGVRWALRIPTPTTDSPPPAWERRSTATTLRAQAARGHGQRPDAGTLPGGDEGLSSDESGGSEAHAASDAYVGTDAYEEA